MKHPLIGLILLFLLMVPLSAAATKQYRITFQANESAPYWTEKDSLGGMGSEIIQAISKEMGISTKIEFRPLKRLIADTTNNDLGNPLFYMENQSFAAIVPITMTYSAFFAYVPHLKVCTKPEEDRRFGVLHGTISDPRTLAAFGQFEESYSNEALFKKLQKGRIHFAVQFDLVGNKMIHDLFLNEVDNFKMQTVSKTASPIAIMIDISTPDALKIGHLYQEGLHRIIKKGTYQKILQKYYGKTPIPSEWYSNLSHFEALYALPPLRDDQ